LYTLFAVPAVNDRDVKQQREWGWQVAVDLYFAGAGAGALIIGLLMDWLGYSPYPSRMILLWGSILVAFGALFLISKLGVKRRFLNTMLNPKKSWLSRGFFILSGCIVFGTLNLFISTLPLIGINIGSWSSLIRALDIIVFIFALAAAVYTGILLGSVRYISFWKTCLLPALFTVSSLATGTVITILATYTYDSMVFSEGYSSQMRLILMNILAVLILLEAIMLVLYLQNRYKVAEGNARNSVLLLLFGRLRLVFWLGVVAVGFLLPVIIGVFLRFSQHSYLLFAAGEMMLLGRFFLRMGIVYAGVKDPTPLHRFAELRSEMLMDRSQAERLKILQNS